MVDSVDILEVTLLRNASDHACSLRGKRDSLVEKRQVQAQMPWSPCNANYGSGLGDKVCGDVTVYVKRHRCRR